MKKISILFIGIVLPFLLKPERVYSFSPNWQKGLTLRLINESKSDVEASLKNLKATGANYVTITPGWLTDSTTSSNVERKLRTPTDDLLTYTIDTAHDLGISVMIKPHIDTKNGRWRANIDPTDKAAFFKNYKSMIMHYAVLSQSTGVEQFSVGAELYKLTSNKSNETYWRDIISSVRGSFKGKVTYSANFGDTTYDELNAIPFWDALDYVGLSAYQQLSNSTSPSISSVVEEWAKVESKFIYPAVQRLNKPFLITEIGYRSADGAAMAPEDPNLNAKVDLKEQADMYEAFFQFWTTKSYMHGVHFWDWKAFPYAGGSTNNDYTPQNKPAEDVLKKYFIVSDTTSENRDNTDNPDENNSDNEDPSNPENSDESPAQTTPSTEPINQEPQNQEAPSIPETPNSESDNPEDEIVVEFKEQEDSTIELIINSPSNNSKISGEKKLKIYIEDVEPSTYKATYNVDDRGEVEMTNSGKFKQSKINFDEWNWNADGPYNVEFKAVDSSGNSIAAANLTLYVKH